MHILFFAQLKNATNCDSVDLPVAAPLNVEQLWAELLERFPALTTHRACVRLARNLEYADAHTLFSQGDEVALIPPVSGG